MNISSMGFKILSISNAMIGEASLPNFTSAAELCADRM
jgi:hypothetical protein